MGDPAGVPSFWAMLFFGADITAKRAIDTRIAAVRANNAAIADEHSLDTLLDDIEDVRAEGEAAMGGLTDE